MINAVRIWILLSTLLVASGWILSAFHELNRAGYCIVFALATAAFIIWRRKTGWHPEKSPAQLLQKFKSRFKRLPALVFLLLALLTLVAGLLYVPSNADSNAYRIPRVLHWLGAQQWQWVHTLDMRMNIAGCGMEWFFAPLILITRSDRLLFLPNWLSFLMLPGLIFSIFIRLRVSPRVAWWWMWLLPSGWCYIMQAGSTINDSFAAVYALAAVDLALRARKNSCTRDFWLAMFSAALVTGVKQTVIPLALPGVIAILPGIRLLLKRWILSLGAIIACLIISAIPITYFNLEYTGNWLGIPKTWAKNELNSPMWGVIGNTFCMTLENLKPPIFPFVGAWDSARKHFLHTPFGTHFLQFEDFGQLSLGVGESTTGIGLGICLLAILSLFYAKSCGPTAVLNRAREKPDWIVQSLIWIPWALTLLFMAKNGAVGNARQFAAYYIFLFPSFLRGPGYEALVRKRWWQNFAVVILFFAAILLIISRDRPLFPAQAVTDWLHSKYPNSKFVSKLAYSYELVPEFESQTTFLEKVLPSDEKVIGYALVERTSEPALWFPFGRRTVVRILPDDTPDQAREQGIHYIVVEDDFLSATHQTIEQFLLHYQGTIVTKWDFSMGTGQPRIYFYLVRLEND